DLLLCGEGSAARPRIYGESDAERLQIGVVLWARFLLWRDKRSRKPRVCNDAIEREKSSSQTNTPEYDRTSDRMDSLSQRDQAGNARDYQRQQAHRYQHSKGDDYFPRAGIRSCRGGFHDSLSLLCIWDGGLQSKAATLRIRLGNARASRAMPVRLGLVASRRKNFFDFPIVTCHALLRAGRI